MNLFVRRLRCRGFDLFFVCLSRLGLEAFDKLRKSRCICFLELCRNYRGKVVLRAPRIEGEGVCYYRRT